MLAVEMLHDEEQIEWKDQFLFAQTAGVPEYDQLIFDIRQLAEFFIRDAARRLGVSVPRLTKAQERELQSYEWPGNVRELQNIIERAVILARDGRLKIELPQTARGTRKEVWPTQGSDENENPDDLSLDELAVREREIVATALQRRNWKIYGPDGAAALLRVKPTTLVSMIKRLNLNRPG
jgi:transcriptional regulator with GAF, ATPase, and Fis domain